MQSIKKGDTVYIKMTVDKVDENDNQCTYRVKEFGVHHQSPKLWVKNSNVIKEEV